MCDGFQGGKSNPVSLVLCVAFVKFGSNAALQEYKNMSTKAELKEQVFSHTQLHSKA